VRDYCDVWTLIEAPETFSIQREALVERAGEFGAVFLERTLIACLMSAADYVEAQRVRAAMIDDMRRVWQTCDVLLTAGAGPAPVLGPALAKWPSLNRFSPFALLGAPAIVVPSGYSDQGLPLSIQLVGKPFDDARLLGIAHAYEQATRVAWRRAPDLSKAQPPASVAQPLLPSIAQVEPRILELCARATLEAGLTLHEEQLAILCHAAPHVLDMLARVRGSAGSAEPANVFSAGSST
jgi:aspartyl-tRNA(Asn)/glutamyl-tRNA(Gln) amidotransferase subunit A